MTISSDLNKHVYDGNGITINWPYTFQIILESDIKVYLTSPEEVTTLLTANYEIDTDNSRVVYPTPASLLDPLPTGWHITLLREEPYTQETDLKSQGPWSAEVLELAYDKLTMLCQQLKEITNRCIKYAIDQNPTDTTTSSFLSAIETARDTAGGYADAALVSKNAAAVSAAAALVSQNAASASASAASGSASAASSSASAASGSASAASGSASAASGSAIAADASADLAAASESAASGYASAASASASAASGSASSASSSAGTATTQAGIATTKAGEANDSAIAAAASAALISDPLLRDNINEATAGHGTAINGAKVKGGTNTFSITNGTASLDVAAGATLNVDANLTIELASAVNQDLTSDASPTFANVTATTAFVGDTIRENTTGHGVGIQGNTIITNDVQLTGSTADGFAATPTAIYNMDATGADAPDAAYTGTKVGAYDLTVKGQSLASGADALGNAKYCQFAGSGYLISTNAVFDFSGTFALGFKMFFPDWTPASAATIISNADAANAGCRLDLSTAGVLTWYENGVAICSVNVSGFDATKFYGGEIWRDATTVYIIIDGVIVASGARGTITQKAVFQISGYNGATQLMPAGSRVDEVFVDFVNTHTADTLRNIYARSAKKFAVKAQDGGVALLDGDRIPLQSDWVEYTPIVTGFSSTSVATAAYRRVGNLVYMSYTVTGTSNANAFSIQMPFVGKEIGGQYQYHTCFVAEGSTYQAGCAYANTNGTLVVRKIALDAWATSGSKAAYGSFVYEAA